MAMCVGPEGVAVDEVHKAVSIAVKRSADGCLIKHDAQDVSNLIDAQRLC